MIKPQVSMPVLYWPHKDDHFVQYGVEPQPLAATISFVWSDSCVNLAVMDANGLVQNRTIVLLHQGRDNATEDMGAALGRFCEFPEWFIKLFTPTFIVNPAPIARLDLPLDFVVGVAQTVASPAGTPDKLQCCNDPRCTLCGCIPTSQVLG